VDFHYQLKDLQSPYHHIERNWKHMAQPSSIESFQIPFFWPLKTSYYLE
jgi:hypothetical protein